MEKIYDVIIVGGGPAGYTCALYSARAGLSTIVFEKFYAGGQMAITNFVENYPGFDMGIDGFDLAERMKKQAERFGVETKLCEVKALRLDEKIKKLDTCEGEFLSKTVVIATGASPKELGVYGEEKFKGRGVHYCASCDGMFYKDKTVMVVGGGDTAVSDALLLSRIAKKVILVHRRDTLKATKIYHESLFSLKNIEFVWNSTVKEIVGENKLDKIILENLQTKETKEVVCDGVFISIGRRPATALVDKQVNLNEQGYILSGEDTKTNLEGVFAIGDVRTKALRQVVTAVGDGATCVYYIEEYLANFA